MGLRIPVPQSSKGFLREVLGPEIEGAVEGRANSEEKERRRVVVLVRQDLWRPLLLPRAPGRQGQT